MALIHDNFWREVLGCTTQCVTPIDDLLGEAKVRDAQMSIRRDQQVLRLEVTVRHLTLVQVLQCERDLCDIKERDVVREQVLLTQ